LINNSPCLVMFYDIDINSSTGEVLATAKEWFRLKESRQKLVKI
jgi:hypothetical protein